MIKFNRKKHMHSNKNDGGFTLLELIIVLFFITVIIGISTVFFANLLPSNKFNSTVRDVSTTIRYARNLARTSSESQILTVDIDTKQYGIEGRGFKSLPSDTYIEVIDPFAGEVTEGKYQFVFHPNGSLDSGIIVLWNAKKAAGIQIDPIVGTVVIK